MKKKVAIIGSGIAGLTLANFLQGNNNFDFVVYEKEETPNLNEGFGIQLSVNGVVILNKIGFNQINKNEKYHPSKLDLFSINCTKICDLDLTKFNSVNEKYTTLKRSVLINFLKSKLLSNSIIFGKKIDKVEKIEDRISIHFSDGSSDEVDFLIVSDGIFSNTKSIIEKKIIKPNYHGAIAVRTQIKTQDVLNINKNNISIIMGSKAHMVLYPINHKREFNLVCIIRNKLENNYSIIKILENTILKENKNLNSLFKGNLKSWPIYTSSKPINSIHKNILYIGDAFCTFLPTMAQGASQAIEAAEKIYDLISNNHKDIENEYFNNRAKRTNLINKRSKFNYFIFHISNPVLKILRNKFLKYFIKNDKFIQFFLGKIYK